MKAKKISALVMKGETESVIGWLDTDANEVINALVKMINSGDDDAKVSAANLMMTILKSSNAKNKISISFQFKSLEALTRHIFNDNGNITDANVRFVLLNNIMETFDNALENGTTRVLHTALDFIIQLIRNHSKFLIADDVSAIVSRMFGIITSSNASEKTRIYATSCVVQIHEHLYNPSHIKTLLHKLLLCFEDVNPDLGGTDRYSSHDNTGYLVARKTVPIVLSKVSEEAIQTFLSNTIRQYFVDPTFSWNKKCAAISMFLQIASSNFQAVEEHMVQNMRSLALMTLGENNQRLRRETIFTVEFLYRQHDGVWKNNCVGFLVPAILSCMQDVIDSRVQIAAIQAMTTMVNKSSEIFMIDHLDVLLQSLDALLQNDELARYAGWALLALDKVAAISSKELHDKYHKKVRDYYERIRVTNAASLIKRASEAVAMAHNRSIQDRKASHNLAASSCNTWGKLPWTFFKDMEQDT